ncbi:TRAP transporter substrate-binding protein DctP [Shimia sediminis]|uniref:TRAP transporter substrate-binding protein DctP n=1 Tax=Shimia sediminis TaxID=2497945 RepID=UPI000F8E6D25|nr:TRAP transporter substrate-binding protein DctP [Shimia sediminis]
MKLISSLAQTVAAGTAAALIAGSAMAEDITLKFAGVHPVNHYANTMLEQIKTDIEAADVGLTVKVFPAGQLGSGEELLDDAMRGNIDLVHGFIYPNRAKALEILSLPFLASTRAEIDAVYRDSDSEFNQILDETFDGLGLNLMAVVPEGFIGIVTTKKPDNHATADAKNINIRVWGSQIAKSLVETIGYNATTMNWGEVFAALQSGAVDGAICCTAEQAYTAFAQSDVGDYFIPYNATVEMTAYYASGETWNKLSDEQRIVVQSAFTKAANDFADHALSVEDEFLEKLQESGYEILDITDEERGALAATVRETVWPQAADIVGADVLDRLTN